MIVKLCGDQGLSETTSWTRELQRAQARVKQKEQGLLLHILLLGYFSAHLCYFFHTYELTPNSNKLNKKGISVTSSAVFEIWI